MKWPQIQINAVSGKIGIQKTPTAIEMKQPMADMKIRQPHADVKYIQRDAEIKIDQSEAFADAGLKPISQHIQEWAAKGRQQVLKAMATAARQGDQMMKIENKGLVIQQIAKTNSENPMREFNIGFIPSSPSRVKIHYTPGEFKVNAAPKGAEIQINPNQPQIKVRTGSTKIYLQQKPSISFSMPGLNVDYKK
ncbi:DUF6470 family protein [Cytobacillus sp. NCCP-133]|uniref:DUF6470 family protein n=1 Tax=Cytobacillus sp. NCCP-133 TaxID=766848 RepID=UPI00222ECEB0|nr:DUF6470 family protein [Cytobacillus sp. NCCP-133]GLB60191.1 hypothetical protein NCCP133_23230 [Cytobacillus sp. NCCP-133]